MNKIILFLSFFASLCINAQSLTTVSPNTGTAGESLQVTITGSGTDFTQISDNSISFYNSMSQNFLTTFINVISDTQVIADIIIPYFVASGSYTVLVQTENGEYMLPNAFTVTNTANTITGNVGVDVDGNGCDASDIHMAGIKVKLYDGSTDSYTYTDNLGNYTFYVPAGNFVVSPEPEFPYYLSTPLSATINFPTQNNLSQTQDFCLAPNGIHNDVEITLVPLGPPLPGFDTLYKIFYKNHGNQTVSGTVNFNFDDSRLDFVSATPSTSSQTVNNLTWNYSNLLPFEGRLIYVWLNVNSPTETPAVNIGDTLNSTATVNPVAGDDTPEGNTAYLMQTVNGSFDPNDKTVAEGEQVAIENADDYLHYIIRFQNTGTYAAQNVVIKDMLSSNLDMSTLEVISASHPYRTTLTDGNKLEFFFENINLPYASLDEPGSHGFVDFKIKPVSTVALGSLIENSAEIYFDFNFPIITNMVATTFTQLGTSSFSLDNAIQLYPNPAGNILNIDMISLSVIESVRIYNQLGQLIKTVTNFEFSQKNSIAVNDLITGSYYVQIITDKGTSTKKLIKL